MYLHPKPRFAARTELYRITAVPIDAADGTAGLFMMFLCGAAAGEIPRACNKPIAIEAVASPRRK
jgi:hypothetical protein